MYVYMYVCVFACLFLHCLGWGGGGGTANLGALKLTEQGKTLQLYSVGHPN